jgi:hypothetical protein
VKGRNGRTGGNSELSERKLRSGGKMGKGLNFGGEVG